MLKLILQTIWQFARVLLGTLGTALWEGLRPAGQLLSAVFQFRPGEMRGPVIVVVSLLAITGSVWSLYSRYHGATSLDRDAIFGGVGEVVADETIRLLNGRGQVVIWKFDAGGAKHTQAERMLDSFRRRLRQRSSITVGRIESVPMSHDLLAGEGGLTAEQFNQLLAKNYVADAVVSFAGAPRLAANDIRQLRADRPKIIIAVDAEQDRTRMAIEQGVVQEAITPRPIMASTPKKPSTRREWFDQYFMIVTTQNVATLTLTQ